MTTATQARDAALDQVDRGMTDDERAALLAAVRVVVARASGPFTTDDVWEVFRASGATIREPRALGAVMRTLEAEGAIRPLARWEQSTQESCHARPKRAWVRCEARAGIFDRIGFVK